MSRISANLQITGNLKSIGNLHVDGRVTGDIKGRNVVVGEHAIVDGEIDCESVTIHGTVNGEVRAMTVTLASSARVVGDIAHESLTIETGARLEGSVRPYAERLADADNGRIEDSSADIALIEHGGDGDDSGDGESSARKVGS